LYLVPQDRKFCSNLASEIIWQSVRWIPNFSALKAASAFEAIEKYAANLINQPWRKEFKTIKVNIQNKPRGLPIGQGNSNYISE
jgi:spermatogenesis-associated protein 2